MNNSFNFYYHKIISLSELDDRRYHNSTGFCVSCLLCVCIHIPESIVKFSVLLGIHKILTFYDSLPADNFAPGAASMRNVDSNERFDRKLWPSGRIEIGN